MEETEGRNPGPSRGQKVLRGMGRGLGQAFPRGIRNPDDMVTNRYLYTGSALNAGKLFGLKKNAAITGTTNKIRLF
jgi:hypothetical protein